MNYTLCNNSECRTKNDCLRWKNFSNPTPNNGILQEQQIFVQTFVPYNENMCKYKLIRIGNENQ